MQRHSALTFQFPRAYWICYFIPSHSAQDGFVLALGGHLLLPLSTLHAMPWQRVSEMASKFKVHHVGHLSSPVFTAYVSESAQHPCPSPWTPHLGHPKSSAFQPVPFQITPDLWCTTVLKLEAKI